MDNTIKIEFLFYIRIDFRDLCVIFTKLLKWITWTPLDLYILLNKHVIHVYIYKLVKCITSGMATTIYVSCNREYKTICSTL